MVDRIEAIQANLNLVQHKEFSPIVKGILKFDVPWLLAEVQRLSGHVESARYHHQRHAEAVREVEQLRARLDAVRALHKPGQSVTTQYCTGCSKLGDDGVWLRLVNYPCPTLRALDGESMKDGA